MAAEERWYFSKEKLANTPSRKCGVDPDKELSYRQQAANFIQDMGQRLQVNQLCINTAIVYVHRFYMFHSFTRFHRNAISTCALFLAAKVEEQPRKLEHVIKVAHMCLHRDAPPLDSKSEAYLEQSQELISNENIMLQTLGFDVAIDHPHTHVVKCCQLVRGHHHHATASKELAQTSYFMATNSLHLTTMCLQYKPTVVACVCIHLAGKWAELQIPISSEGKDWYWYVDKTVSFELLEELTAEFLLIFDRCPSRLKRKMMSSTGMNDKIQDVAMVEKKLTAELAAHASGNKAAAGSSLSSRGTGDRFEKKIQNASWPSSMTAKVLGHGDEKNPDAEHNGTPSTPEVRKEWASAKRDASLSSSSSVLNSFASSSKYASSSSGSMANCTLSSGTASIAPSSSSLSPPPPTSPRPMILSPIRQPGKQSSSSGYGSMSTSDSWSGNQDMSSALTVEHPRTPPPQQPSTPETPKKSKGEHPLPQSQPQRGLTPKEYKERKKRERSAAAAEMAADIKPLLTELTTPPPVKERRKRTSSSSSSGSQSGNAMPLAARHMQPIVALTSLNLDDLANKLSTPPKQCVNAKYARQQVTPEKHSRTSSSSASSYMSTSTSSDRKMVAMAAATNDDDDDKISPVRPPRAKSREDSLPALVRPPILTPSPPLATGEESKPDILDEKPMTLSFPSEDVTANELSPPPPPKPSSSLSRAFQTCSQTLSFADIDLHQQQQHNHYHQQQQPQQQQQQQSLLPAATNDVVRVVKGPTTPPLPPPPSAAAAEVRHPELKSSSKERSFKTHHRTSKTQHKVSQAVHQVPPPLPAPLAVIEPPSRTVTMMSAATSVPNMVTTTIGTSTMVSKNQTFPAMSDDQGLTSRSQLQASAAAMATPIARLTQNTENGTQENPTSLSIVNSSTLPQEPVDRKSGQSATVYHPPPVSLASPALVAAVAATANSTVVATGISAAPSEVYHSDKDRDKDKYLVVPVQQPTKQERREKHRHKDKDRDKDRSLTKSSKDKDKGKGSTGSTVKGEHEAQAPSIKLTIPKDRLNMSLVTVDGSGRSSSGAASGRTSKEGSGALKIKIPKQRLSKSKAMALSEPAAPQQQQPPPPQAAPPPPPPSPATPPVTATVVSVPPTASSGFGLKIKITKDKLGSMGTYSVGSREDVVKDKKESRKRERPPSPPPPPPPPPPPQPSFALQTDINSQRPSHLPLTTVLQPTSPTNSKPPKIAKTTSTRSARKSQSPQAVTVSTATAVATTATVATTGGTSLDVPPSSNTRSSSSKQDHSSPQSDNYKSPVSGGGRGGHRGGGKSRGRGGGGLHGHPHPRFDSSHSVTLNAGPYPYTPYFQYGPNYFTHPPPMGPPPPLPHHPHGPIHPADYPPPPPPPPFYGQPPPFRGPPIMSGAYPNPNPRTDLRVMPLQIRRQLHPPPLPPEPPPSIPPPPPPPE